MQGLQDPGAPSSPKELHLQPLFCVLYAIIPQELSTLPFDTGLFIGLDLIEAGPT